MKYAIIDTEGSGLFRYKDERGVTIPSDAPGQPRLAAMALILLNDDLSVQEKYMALVKPDGWTMSVEATAINGLTDERLMAEGKPATEVCGVYTQAVKEGFSMVAFNAQHDLRQMRGALRFAGMPDLFMETRNVCVMRKARGVIPRRDGKNNWPSLADCRVFLKIESPAIHTAGGDVDDALAVFLHLHAQGVDLTPEVHFANQGGKPKEPKAPKAKALPEAVTADDEIPE